MPIGEFCNREVIVADPATTVQRAAELMRQYHVGCLVVLDSLKESRRPLGVVTDRDIVLEVVARKVAPDSVTLGDLLAGPVATVRISDGVYDTMYLMRQRGYRRMPVVNDVGELVGIVSMDDFLGLLAEELTELTRLINHEQGREMESRR